MNNLLNNVLNHINEGIVILDTNLEIYAWNRYMEVITGISRTTAKNNNIAIILPAFNKNYFKKSMNDVINSGCKMFFSAAMHRNLLDSKEYFNLKISSLESENTKFLLLEFINVTNQFVQIKRLKEYVSELSTVNKKLKEKEKVIKKLAYYDELTGVANRTLFYELAHRFMDNAKRNNSILGLMFIDVDDFKNINDTYGHEVGDKVLIQVADILKKATRKNDVVARHGGDEFLILLPFIQNSSNYKIIATRIINTKNSIIDNEGNKINISLSMGISFYPTDGNDIDKLIAKADKAMYIAKGRRGRDNYCCSACICP